MKLTENEITILGHFVEEGLVNKVKHPVYDIYNYKYSQACHTGNIYGDPLLKMCRGLVLDSTGNILSRGFEKFFNDFELTAADMQAILSSDVEITEKFDGTCVLLSQYNGKKYFRTLGSFTSWQSDYCNHHFLQNPDWEFAKDFDWLETLDTCHYTYIFEFLHPDDRKVVRYNFDAGENPRLVLIGIIETETGKDLLYKGMYGHLSALGITPGGIEMIHPLDLKKDVGELMAMNIDNKEGFVLHSTVGRMKVKFKKYWELFNLRFQLTPEKIFDKWVELHSTDPNEVKRGEYIDSLKELDVETAHYVEEAFCDYDVFYDDFAYDIYHRFSEYYKDEPDRKTFALRIADAREMYPALMFAHYDMVTSRRKYQDMIRGEMKKRVLNKDKNR